MNFGSVIPEILWLICVGEWVHTRPKYARFPRTSVTNNYIANVHWHVLLRLYCKGLRAILTHYGMWVAHWARGSVSADGCISPQRRKKKGKKVGGRGSDSDPDVDRTMLPHSSPDAVIIFMPVFT